MRYLAIPLLFLLPSCLSPQLGEPEREVILRQEIVTAELVRRADTLTLEDYQRAMAAEARAWAVLGAWVRAGGRTR